MGADSVASFFKLKFITLFFIIVSLPPSFKIEESQLRFLHKHDITFDNYSENDETPLFVDVKTSALERKNT